jgi:hypothetical protein
MWIMIGRSSLGNSSKSAAVCARTIEPGLQIATTFQ